MPTPYRVPGEKSVEHVATGAFSRGASRSHLHRPSVFSFVVIGAFVMVLIAMMQSAFSSLSH